MPCWSQVTGCTSIGSAGGGADYAFGGSGAASVEESWWGICTVASGGCGVGAVADPAAVEFFCGMVCGREVGGSVDECAEDPSPATGSSTLAEDPALAIGSSAVAMRGAPPAATSGLRRADRSSGSDPDAVPLAAIGGGSTLVHAWCPDGEHMKYRNRSIAWDWMSTSFSPLISPTLT